MLLFGGTILAFLMVLQLLESSFPLCFLSYALMCGGFVLGFIGIVQQWRSRR